MQPKFGSHVLTMSSSEKSLQEDADSVVRHRTDTSHYHLPQNQHQLTYPQAAMNISLFNNFPPTRLRSDSEGDHSRIFLGAGSGGLGVGESTPGRSVSGSGRGELGSPRGGKPPANANATGHVPLNPSGGSSGGGRRIRGPKLHSGRHRKLDSDDTDSRAMITLNDSASTGVADSTMDLPEIAITSSAGHVMRDSEGGPIDENKERGNWSNGLEFFLSCLSYAVGLGNVWRFPYLCYRNGGGAFLIPYALMLLFVGLPLFFLELAFGQYASEGPITIWKISPLFQGLGYAMFLMSGLVGIYYNMILAWAMFYLVSSFTTTLPWKSCDNWWNTNACRRFDTKNCTGHGGIQLANSSCILQGNMTNEEFQAIADLKENSKTPSDEYFHNFVLDLTDGIHDLGGVRLELVACLFICWTIVFVCLARGVKSMGKVVYFTALFPYFVLTTLLIRGASLPGAADGIIFYLTPDWSRLTEARVWADAAMQIFFSLSPCWGGLITLASYNKFHNNCLKNSISIAFGNCGTSFYAGFVIFSIIGFMAHELGVPVKEVAAEGAGLAFIAYPEAVSRLPISPLWSCLFFFMLLTLGIGTQFTLIETVCTTIVDTWPDQLRHRKAKVLLCVCIFMFLTGSIMCTQGGMYVLQLMDNHCASFSALIIGITEVTVIAWIYGVDRFMGDIKAMLGHYPYPRWYWSFCWKYGCPTLISIILVFSFFDFKPSQYGSYVYPAWANYIGWGLTFIPVSAIPIVAFLRIKETRGRSLWEKIQRLIRPTADWGPKLQKHRNEARIPKHTDSQVPLAYETADDNEDFEDDDDDDDDDDGSGSSDDGQGGHGGASTALTAGRGGSSGGTAGSKSKKSNRNEVYYYPDDISDNGDTGLKLNNVSYSHETGF